MTTPNAVVIKGERHLIILGQFGNLGWKLEKLNQVCIDANHHALVGMIGEIVEELDYLRKVYPVLDGDITPVDFQRPMLVGETDSPKINKSLPDNKIRNALKDMRLLMDVAATTYQVEGNIDCHLKVMLDEAWGKAAIQVGIDVLDDLPF